METSVFTIEAGTYEDHGVEYIVVGPPIDVDAHFQSWCEANPHKLKFVNSLGIQEDSPVVDWDTIRRYVKYLSSQGYTVIDNWDSLYFRDIIGDANFDNYGNPDKMFRR